MPIVVLAQGIDQPLRLSQRRKKQSSAKDNSNLESFDSFKTLDTPLQLLFIWTLEAETLRPPALESSCEVSELRPGPSTVVEGRGWRSHRRPQRAKHKTTKA